MAALGTELRALRTQRGLTLQDLAGLTGYSTQHIGAVERAQVVPSEAVVSGCDTALLADGRLVVMLAGVIREQARVRHQRQVARRAHQVPISRASHNPDALADVGSSVDWERLADARCRGSRVTSVVVEDLEEITSRHRQLYHHLASADMLVHVRSQLGLLTTLLENQPTEPLRRRIASAATEAAGFAAWLWFDLGDWLGAQRCYDQATCLAEESLDDGLGSYVKGYRGLVATHTSGPSQALEHLDAARDMAPRSLSGTTRAWLSILTAQALAHAGNAEDAIRAIGEAHEFLTESRSDGAEAWMYDFDQGSLAAHTGMCHLVLNQPRQASNAFIKALRLLPPGCERRRARIHIGLAEAHLAHGDTDEALHLAGAALVAFAHHSSGAGLRSVRRVRDIFHQTGRHAAANALDDQARALQHRSE